MVTARFGWQQAARRQPRTAVLVTQLAVLWQAGLPCDIRAIANIAP